tara:strand:+ start:340 stop:768 length:429 start_codon:yes stop_codon:yes gene_type:complete
MRKDKKENLEKVAGSIAKGVETVRGIAKDAGVSVGTAKNMSDELGHNLNIKQTHEVVDIQKKDLDIIKEIQDITCLMLPKIKTSIESNNLVSIQELGVLHQVAEKSQKRYSFLAGENSKENGGEKTDPKQIELARSLISKIL